MVRARKMNVPIIGQPSGTTRALNEVTIRARVKGFLKEKHFVEGSTVKKGELLLVIDEEPFKVKVAQAKAVLEEAEAALKKAKESKSRRSPRPRSIWTQTQLELDRVEERRERNLLARKAASQEDYDRAKAEVEKSAAQVEAAKAALQQVDGRLRHQHPDRPGEDRPGQGRSRSGPDRPGILPDVRPDRRPDRRAPGEAGQPRRARRRDPATPRRWSRSSSSIPWASTSDPASRYLPLISKLVKSGLEVSLSDPGPAAPSAQGEDHLRGQHGRPHDLDGAGEGRGAQPRADAPPRRVREGGPEPGRLRRRRRRARPRPWSRPRKARASRSSTIRTRSRSRSSSRSIPTRAWSPSSRG